MARLRHQATKDRVPLIEKHNASPLLSSGVALRAFLGHGIGRRNEVELSGLSDLE